MNSTLEILNQIIGTGVNAPVVRLIHAQDGTAVAKVLRGNLVIPPVTQTPEDFCTTLETLVERASGYAAKSRN